jgi:cell division protein FtsI/penicillin-binding protein 2
MHLLAKRRIYIACILLTLIFGLLILRLGWVQLVQVNQAMPGFHRTVREMSVLQRERGVMLDPGRGQFTDYKGEALTGKLQWGLILFPQAGPLEKLRKQGALEGSEMIQLAAILHTDLDQLKKEWNQENTPHFWTAGAPQPVHLTDAQVERLRSLHLQGAGIYPMMTRYLHEYTGMQWLGYVAEQPRSSKGQPGHQDEVRQPFAMKSGAAGLERTLEPLLRGIGPTLVSRMVSGGGEIIPEIQPHVIAPANSHYPLRVETTVDGKLQRGLEQLVEEYGLKEGAVVVLDVANADVRAMISRPFYQPQHVDPKQSAWGNRAVQGAVPGSIFKIVTAAAALEYHAVSNGEEFHCGGEYGKYGLSCWKEHGHGYLNLEQGFAESCNIVFAETARKLSMEQLEQTADRLGLARPIGWEGKKMAGMPVLRHFDHEDHGRFRTEAVSSTDEGAKIQTAIGQRDVLVTPLQAANLIVTLLHDGKVSAPRLVERIRYADGGTMLEVPLHDSPSEAGQIAPATAHTLLSWMDKVVREGTGKSLQRARWHVAGKSGTAQVQKNGKKRNDQWFIGYGPIERPKYAVAVLVQNVSPDSHHQATAVFRKVMDYLAESS